MKPFPSFSLNRPQDVEQLLQFMVKERPNDVSDWNALAQKFVSGRKVGKIPSSSADITSSDKIGDISYDASYLYIVVDNSGTAEWRRATLGSW